MPRGPWHEEVDLIVVGASVAGLAAAAVAADRGCRTVVVERAKEVGGGAAAEPEYVAAAGTRFQKAAGIDDGPARLVDDVLAAMRGGAEPDVATAVAEQGPAVVAWLADRCGVPIALVGGHVPRGHSAARLHAPGERGGAGLVADLARAAGRHARVAVRTGAAVERLVIDEMGTVRGVAVRGDRRGVSQAIAGRVLLACGGFVGEQALVAEHCPAIADLPYHGAATATGEALRFGREARAATRRLGGCLVTPFLATPAGLVVTAPLVDLGAVLVNQAGRRFVRETDEPLRLASAIRATAGHMAYLLFDERIAQAARGIDPFFAHVVLPRTGRRGVTPGDLARQVELDLDGLQATIAATGADPFGREPPPASLEPPLHAIRVTGARWRTLGGLAVDGAARVLADDGRPIPGLYAAGGAAAGLGGDGTNGLLAGVDTLTALALARLAALDIAAAVAADDEQAG
jgi:fumarate reductase flavoprotein subunit